MFDEFANPPKGKGKEPVTKAELVFDYHDGSVGDLELKTHLLRGYELFKVCLKECEEHVP